MLFSFFFRSPYFLFFFFPLYLLPRFLPPSPSDIHVHASRRRPESQFFSRRKKRLFLLLLLLLLLLPLLLRKKSALRKVRLPLQYQINHKPQTTTCKTVYCKPSIDLQTAIRNRNRNCNGNGKTLTAKNVNRSSQAQPTVLKCALINLF